MSGTVLIATPARTTTPKRLRQRHEELVHSLTYPAIEWRLWPNEPPRDLVRYEKNAWARNEFIKRFVKPYHQWVMWLDADIIEMPPDTVERLMAISEAHGGAIVAPMVWMEKVKDGPTDLDTGGWFYDVGGFIDRAGNQADFFAGVAGNERVVEMQSVGCVYLAPARLYLEDKLRYASPGGQAVEHVAFCRAARQTGIKVLATRDFYVTHAYLPKYGEAWHSS